MAVIKVFYDGSSQGHEIPVFQDQFIIGREDADLTIPHDTLISKRHAALRRSKANDPAGWVLEDLQSTNGTFASIEQAILQNGQEALLGSRRYRFDLPAVPAATTDRKQTGVWRLPTTEEASLPVLTEVNEGQDGRRHELSATEVTIGSDSAASQISITDDPFLSPQHASIAQDSRGRWVLKPISALNGVWVRIRSTQITKNGLFQIGEQRISVRVP